MATSSVTATGFSSSFHGSWGNSMAGEDYGVLVAKTTPKRVRIGNPLRYGPMMGNVNEGKGLFAPVVVVTRNIVGKKRFNQLRGKAIALHSQEAKGMPLCQLGEETTIDAMEKVSDLYQEEVDVVFR